MKSSNGTRSRAPFRLVLIALAACLSLVHGFNFGKLHAPRITKSAIMSVPDDAQVNDQAFGLYSSNISLSRSSSRHSFRYSSQAAP